MVRKHLIICPHCNKHSGYTQEQLMFYVLTHDLKCKHCGEVVVKCAPRPEFCIHTPLSAANCNLMG